MILTLNKSDARFIADSIRLNYLEKNISLMECCHIDSLMCVKDVDILKGCVYQEGLLTFFGGMTLLSTLMKIIEAGLTVLVGNIALKGVKKAAGMPTTADKIDKITKESESLKNDLQKYRVELNALRGKIQSSAEENKAAYMKDFKKLAVKIIREYRNAIALRFDAVALMKDKDKMMTPGSFSASSRILANVSIVLMMFALTATGVAFAKMIASLIKRIFNFMKDMPAKKDQAVKSFVKSIDSASKSLLTKKKN